jgi:hypothetical protein
MKTLMNLGFVKGGEFLDSSRDCQLLHVELVSLELVLNGNAKENVTIHPSLPYPI